MPLNGHRPIRPAQKRSGTESASRGARRGTPPPAAGTHPRRTPSAPLRRPGRPFRRLPAPSASPPRMSPVVTAMASTARPRPAERSVVGVDARHRVAHGPGQIRARQDVHAVDELVHRAGPRQFPHLRIPDAGALVVRGGEMGGPAMEGPGEMFGEHMSDASGVTGHVMGVQEELEARAPRVVGGARCRSRARRSPGRGGPRSAAGAGRPPPGGGARPRCRSAGRAQALVRKRALHMRMAHGSWLMAHGSWLMAHGGAPAQVVQGHARHFHAKPT